MEAQELIQRYNQGKRDFSGADLSYADLHRVNLRGADLSYADLHRVNLRGADLSGADLHRVNLRCADLSYADLHRVNLSYADLSGADLRMENLRDAILRGAHLHSADLRGANLCNADLNNTRLEYVSFDDANLSNTCLDPTNTPNGECSEFEDFDSGWRIGYRTKRSIHVGRTEYIVGEEYSAPVFSTARTECHPGLYLCPTVDAVKHLARRTVEIVLVIFRPWDCHQAGGKYRVREFIVWEDLAIR